MSRASRWLLVASFLIAAAGCTRGTPEPSASVVKITAPEAYGLLEKGQAVLLDVRESDEIANGMARSADWMPMSRIEAEAPEWEQLVKKLPRDKIIISYCERGPRAEKVATRLARLGFRALYFRGYRDWQAAGLPVSVPAGGRQPASAR